MYYENSLMKKINEKCQRKPKFQTLYASPYKLRHKFHNQLAGGAHNHQLDHL